MLNAPYGFIILAAGISSRLGRPKALLAYRGTSLLGYVVEQMQELAPFPICIVTGGHADLIYNAISTTTATIVFNPHWQEGMRSSIRAGLAALCKTTPLENVIISSCDQPNITADIFRAMIKQRESSKKHIIACAYAGAIGIPALFSKKYFAELIALSGEKGARSLIRKYSFDVATIPFSGGEVDIDTNEDYERLLTCG